MIVKANNALEALDLLNENLEKLIKRERPVGMAKEVNNGVGKITNVVKLMVLEKMRLEDKSPIRWLSDSDHDRRLVELNKIKKISNDK